MPEPVVGLISPGQMGAAVGARLAARGVRVITPAGRSKASEERARAAGLGIVPEADLAGADFVFCIVPPDQAMPTARRVSALPRGPRAPLYVDWNAISPARTVGIGAVVETAGLGFADGSIIGYPGKPADPGPLLVASGPQAVRLEALQDRGVRFRILQAPLGAASALKMSYAGLTKGQMALGAAMMLAARRAGCDQDLLRELAASQPNMLKGFQHSIPDMFGKVERWVPELEEIASFVGSDRVESGIYEQIARFFAYLAADVKGERRDIGVLGSLFPGQ